MFGYFFFILIKKKMESSLKILRNVESLFTELKSILDKCCFDYDNSKKFYETIFTQFVDFSLQSVIHDIEKPNKDYFLPPQLIDYYASHLTKHLQCLIMNVRENLITKEILCQLNTIYYMLIYFHVDVRKCFVKELQLNVGFLIGCETTNLKDYLDSYVSLKKYILFPFTSWSSHTNIKTISIFLGIFDDLSKYLIISQKQITNVLPKGIDNIELMMKSLEELINIGCLKQDLLHPLLVDQIFGDNIDGTFMFAIGNFIGDMNHVVYKKNGTTKFAPFTVTMKAKNKINITIYIPNERYKQQKIKIHQQMELPFISNLNNYTKNNYKSFAKLIERNKNIFKYPYYSTPPQPSQPNNHNDNMEKPSLHTSYNTLIINNFELPLSSSSTSLLFNIVVYKKKAKILFNKVKSELKIELQYLHSEISSLLNYIIMKTQNNDDTYLHLFHIQFIIDCLHQFTQILKREKNNFITKLCNNMNLTYFVCYNYKKCLDNDLYFESWDELLIFNKEIDYLESQLFDGESFSKLFFFPYIPSKFHVNNNTISNVTSLFINTNQILTTNDYSNIYNSYQLWKSFGIIDTTLIHPLSCSSLFQNKNDGVFLITLFKNLNHITPCIIFKNNNHTYFAPYFFTTQKTVILSTPSFSVESMHTQVFDVETNYKKTEYNSFESLIHVNKKIFVYPFYKK